MKSLSTLPDARANTQSVDKLKKSVNSREVKTHHGHAKTNHGHAKCNTSTYQ